jgi:prepilin-type processing-associated H-X9-DG protein
MPVNWLGKSIGYAVFWRRLRITGERVDMHDRWNDRQGAGMVDLVAALFVVFLVSALALAAVVREGEVRNRVRCASNLRQIGQGLLMYANENKAAYPRSIYDAGQSDKPTWGSGPGVAGNVDPFDTKEREDANDVSAALFLLLRTEDIRPGAFVCPSTKESAWDYGGRANQARNWVNWPKESLAKHLSYSYANPYPSKEAVAKGYVLNSSLAAEFPVVADINSGADVLVKLILDSTPEQFRSANSPNHNREGQNVLFGDGHVDFENSVFCGISRDDIYTFGDSGIDPKTDEHRLTGGLGIVGSPVGAGDTVLLPVAQGQSFRDTQ